LFKKIREDLAEIKHKLFVEKPKLETDKPESTVIHARLSLPEAIKVKAETEERTKPWKQDRDFKLQILAVLVGAAVTAIYAGQLDQMIKSNKLTREALESVQRAFIAYHSIECSRGKSGDRIYWSIHPVYENSGNTPALVAVNAYTIAEGKAEIPEEMFKVGKPGELPDKLISTSIAPKALQHTRPYSLDESYIFGMDLGDRFENFIKSHPRDDLSIFGWMVYHDVMPKTKPHLTEFCMHFDSPSLIDENPPKMKFNFANCTQHNCTDEYCPDYSEVVTFAESRLK